MGSYSWHSSEILSVAHVPRSSQKTDSQEAHDAPLIQSKHLFVNVKSKNKFTI